MRQKILCIMVLSALILAFTGCSGNKTASPENQTEGPDIKAADNTKAGNDKLNSASETEIDAADLNNAGEGRQDGQQAKPDAPVSEDFLMQIEDVFSITGRGTVATGKVLAGYVSVEAEVELIGLADEPRAVTVSGIEAFRELKDMAKEGDNVGILLNDLEKSDVQRGQVLAAKGSISAHDTFSADIVFSEKQTDAFFSQGKFNALSYFFTTDSNAVFYFGQDRPDENDKMSVRAQILAKLPMKEGTPFNVLRSGTVIASGVVTGVDVDVKAGPGAGNDESAGQSGPNASDTETSDAAKSDPGTSDAVTNNAETSGPDNSVAGDTNADVKLLSYGNQKIQVVKIIREITGLDLKEAKGLVDNAPSVIKENITQKEAEGIKTKLEAVGAAVEITK